jgi:hypothetical protein
MARKDVTFNLKPLDRFMGKLKRGTGTPVLARMFRQWEARWLAQNRRQFVENSRGGGAWAPLAPSTIARRRPPARGRGRGRGGARAARVVAILRDTNTLYGALTLGATGNVSRLMRFGIRCGIGGPGRHPKAKVTVGQLANWHHVGAGNLPERPVINPPTPPTINGFASDAKRAIQQMGRESK